MAARSATSSLRAQEVIASGVPRLVTYNAESGLDVLMEMGCGGELEVLIEPLRAEAARGFADALAACLAGRHHAWLATVFAVDGVPWAPRRKLRCDHHAGWDDLDDATLGGAIDALLQHPRMQGARQASTVQLPFGAGIADVLVEPVAPPTRWW